MSSIAIQTPSIADPYKNPGSIENRFRRGRFAHIRSLIEDALAERGRVDILDLGGRELYWDIGREFLDAHRGRIRIHLVNLEEDCQPVSRSELFTAQAGDACDRRLLEGRRFDLVHSNSVIEHVGDDERIGRFAENVRRLGARYYVQTPNFWFPLEPHFRVPGYQWLPAHLRTRMLQARRLGFYRRQRSYDDARAIVDSVRLLRPRTMARLFPEADIRMETVLGLPKSIMASHDGR
ncbi:MULTISPECIES: SAM-dependent methyltransferase [unclassified Roseitalea]|uniref:SAM-dependent methyltransferase n=1 Tax=unclassified Roseitalea TaxID=2639107 RepID=UPI00273EB2DF|nr:MULTISPECIES: SAM-dependent methyltransferase [unclassified Roseitalea]